MRQRCLQCWQVPFLLLLLLHLFLTHIVCHHHLRNVMPYAWTLAFLFSGSFVKDLLWTTFYSLFFYSLQVFHASFICTFFHRNMKESISPEVSRTLIWSQHSLVLGGVIPSSDIYSSISSKPCLSVSCPPILIFVTENHTVLLMFQVFGKVFVYVFRLLFLSYRSIRTAKSSWSVVLFFLLTLRQAF